MTPLPPVTICPSLPYQVSDTVSRGIGAVEMFFTFDLGDDHVFHALGDRLGELDVGLALDGRREFLAGQDRRHRRRLNGCAGACVGSAPKGGGPPTTLTPTSVAANGEAHAIHKDSSRKSRAEL